MPRTSSTPSRKIRRFTFLAVKSASQDHGRNTLSGQGGTLDFYLRVWVGGWLRLRQFLALILAAALAVAPALAPEPPN